MVQVRGYTEDDVDVLVDAFVPIIQASLTRAAQKTADQLKPAVTSSSTRDDNLVGASSAGLGPEDAAIFTQYWEEEVDGVLTSYVANVYSGSATSVAVGLGNGFPLDDLPGVPLVADEFQLTFIKSLTPEFMGIGDDVAQDVRQVLVDGVKSGESIEQIAAKMVQVAGFTEVQAKRIARTTVHASAESGSIAQLRYVGYGDDEVEKEWLSTHDGRTRETHVFADKQKVPLSGKFTVGSTHLDYPGDPLGAYSEVVNCRCTALFNIDEAPKLRCNGALPTLTAAAAASSGTCVIPAPTADISGITQAVRNAIFAAFMKHKISAAYGGAKIHKVLKAVRDDSFAGNGFSQPLDDAITDWHILAVVDHMKTGPGASFTPKYAEWLQSTAGKKAVPNGMAHFGVTTPTTPPISLVNLTPSPTTLPPIAGKPLASELEYTGTSLGGVSLSQVWRNPVTGEKWLFKPVSSTSTAYSNKYLRTIEPAVARIQSKALQTRPAIYAIKLNGQSGVIQAMFDATPAWPTGSFSPLSLSATDIATLQREQIFDWMISNHDTHSGQWIRTGDGTLIGIDKGQSFKFFPGDKLHWTYKPVSPQYPNKRTYSTMWQDFVDGKNIDLKNPTEGELGTYIDQLMSIDDTTYRELLRPYAMKRFSSPTDVEQFLNQAVARKNSLKTDFATFWQKALQERALHTTPPPIPPPAPAPPPAPIIVPPSTTTLIKHNDSTPLGDVTAYQSDPFYMHDLMEMWIAVNGDKKVTPAYGGAKIWKTLSDVMMGVDTIKPGMPVPTELQVIRMLDKFGGFKGKPKTLESELLKWLDSPNGKKAVPHPPTSFLTPTAPISPTAPVAAPASLVDPVAAAFNAVGNKHKVNYLFVDLPKYKPGDVIAYVKTLNGDTLRAQYADVGGDVVAVYVRKDSLGETTWKFDKTFDDWTTLYSEYNITANTEWHYVPPPNVIVTHIPGKAPGDVLTFDEIWASRYLWKDGDVIGQSVTPTGTHVRLVSKGNGDMVPENSIDGVTWAPGGTLKATDFVSDPLKQIINNAQFKLSSTSIGTPKTSVIVVGKNVGDPLSADEVFNNLAPFTGFRTVAYGYDPMPFTGVGVQYRLRMSDAGEYLVQTRTGTSTTWQYHSNGYSPTDLNGVNMGGLKFSWHLANNDETMPDVVKAMIPGGSTPSGMSIPTKVPGAMKDEEAPLAVIAMYADSFDSMEYLAYSDEIVGTKYKLLKWNNHTVLVRQISPGAPWKAIDVIPPGVSIQSKVGVTIPSGTKWYATTEKIAWGDSAIPDIDAKVSSFISATPVKKATKKAAKKTATKVATPSAPTPSTSTPTLLHGTSTHIPGKSVGDSWTKDEIWDNKEKYVDGQVIAYIQTYAGKQRIFMMDGHLLVQKQSAAGSWIGTKKIQSKYGIPTVYDTSKMTLSNDVLSTQHKKAAKKFVTNKLGGPAGAPTMTPPLTTAPIGPSGGVPTMLGHVDISAWSQAERLAIFNKYKTIVGSYGSNETKWGGIQQVKSHFQAQNPGKYASLNELEIARIVDEQSALKKGVPDLHKLEISITDWLKTPAGRTFVSRRFDAPIAAADVPIPMSRIGAPGDLPLDRQTYSRLGSNANDSNARARAIRADDYTRYGAPTGTQKAALKKYTGGVYTSWNDAIRRGNLESYKTDILAAQTGMRPSTVPMLLHRKVGWPEFNDPSIVSADSLRPYIGRTYVNRGFNSSATTSGVWSGSVHLEIECPIGTPMAHVQDYSHHPGENETLLAAHLLYQILSVTERGGVTVVRVRVIGAATP